MRSARRRLWLSVQDRARGCETIRLLTCEPVLSLGRPWLQWVSLSSLPSSAGRSAGTSCTNRLNLTGTLCTLIGGAIRAMHWGAGCFRACVPKRSRGSNPSTSSQLWQLLGLAVVDGQLWARRPSVAWNCRCAGPNAVTSVRVLNQTHCGRRRYASPSASQRERTLGTASELSVFTPARQAFVRLGLVPLAAGCRRSLALRPSSCWWQAPTGGNGCPARKH